MGFLESLFGSNGGSPINRISPQQAKENLDKNKNIIILDVRENYEYASGHIQNAKNISVSAIDESIVNRFRDKDATIYVYCQSGSRSSRACNILASLGYTQIYNLGGISSWPYKIIK
ncbi:rhodanese-like domain-containing protein [Clostridium sp.]|uniref:rhodanese-like domain-containing protein n=1 Tax=Clostridium sp. TaxID=1506 RepID=UPI003216AD17